MSDTCCTGQSTFLQNHSWFQNLKHKKCNELELKNFLKSMNVDILKICNGILLTILTSMQYVAPIADCFCAKYQGRTGSAWYVRIISSTDHKYAPFSAYSSYLLARMQDSAFTNIYGLWSFWDLNIPLVEKMKL